MYDTLVSKNPYVRCSYGLLTGCLLLSIAVAPINRWVAFIPAALVFGWSQVGGL